MEIVEFSLNPCLHQNNVDFVKGNKNKKQLNLPFKTSIEKPWNRKSKQQH